jgi:hypothetical protein
MEISGKVVHILPLQSGQGKNGEWRKQDFVIETEGQYPKKVCFSLWGDKINQAAISQNDFVNVQFDVESREYNSRWYTDLKAFRVTKSGGASGGVPPGMDIPPPDFMSDSGGETDDLPF